MVKLLKKIWPKSLKEISGIFANCLFATLIGFIDGKKQRGKQNRKFEFHNKFQCTIAFSNIVEHILT